ncbi:ROK family protein [Roseimaritima sediminicola]|uniref:ROK family protein n=1 Tax=Roseimaritima sediminicola TaxID=2662066 RepID=UPI001298344F|nr:ROK family protein [Roseimaritima sediminicola]
MQYLIGIDVGGTTSTIAAGSPERRVEYVSPQFATRSADGPAATIADLMAAITAFLKQRGAAPGDIAAVSLATPGPATRDGVLLKTPNLDPEQWNRCPIRQLLESALAAAGAPVAVRYLGDGQAAALGEYAVRKRLLDWPEAWNTPLRGSRADFAPERLDSMFMVAVGTGLGGGEVRCGAVTIGREGRAGHAGHIFLPHDAFRYAHDRQFRVGNACSTLESAVSLSALTHQLEFRLGLPEWRQHPLHQVPGSMKDRAKRLRELAADDDGLALELLDDQARALGIGLLQIQYLGDYDLLVIGGGVCDLAAGPRRRYLESARAAYRERALDGFRDFDGFAFSICGDQASVIGALQHCYHD